MGGDKGSKYLRVKEIYVRSSSSSEINRFYNATYLFNIGNYGQYLASTQTKDSYQKICVGSESRKLLLRMPIGNYDHMLWVDYVTLATIWIVIAFIVRIFTIKLWDHVALT